MREIKKCKDCYWHIIKEIDEGYCEPTFYEICCYGDDETYESGEDEACNCFEEKQ